MRMHEDLSFIANSLVQLTMISTKFTTPKSSNQRRWLLPIPQHLALRLHKLVIEIPWRHVKNVPWIQPKPCHFLRETLSFSEFPPLLRTVLVLRSLCSCVTMFFISMTMLDSGPVDLQALVSTSRCNPLPASRLLPCTDDGCGFLFTSL